MKMFTWILVAYIIWLFCGWRAGLCSNCAMRASSLDQQPVQLFDAKLLLLIINLCGCHFSIWASRSLASHSQRSRSIRCPSFGHPCHSRNPDRYTLGCSWVFVPKKTTSFRASCSQASQWIPRSSNPGIDQVSLAERLIFGSPVPIYYQEFANQKPFL